MIDGYSSIDEVNRPVCVEPSNDQHSVSESASSDACVEGVTVSLGRRVPPTQRDRTLQVATHCW